MTSTIRLISDILDTRTQASPELLDLVRVSKIQEEAGEAMAAAIAYQGTNPHKPAGSIDDLVSELADVALTAMCAIEHFDRDSSAELWDRAELVYRRLTDSPAPAGGGVCNLPHWDGEDGLTHCLLPAGHDGYHRWER